MHKKVRNLGAMETVLLGVLIIATAKMGCWRTAQTKRFWTELARPDWKDDGERGRCCLMG